MPWRASPGLLPFSSFLSSRRALASFLAAILTFDRPGITSAMRARPFLVAALLGAMPSAAAPPQGQPAADVLTLEHAPTVASYTLRAVLDPVAHRVRGSGTITWTNASRKAVSELWMHLYLNAFKNQSSVFMRAPVGGFRGSTVPTTWGAIDVSRLVWVDGKDRHDLLASMEKSRPGDEDETDARIPLPREVPSGATIELEVAWEDTLPSIVERTGFDGSFHMVGQWFPKIAKIEPDGTFAHFPFHHLGEFYADFGRYDVTIDVPQGFSVGATGPRVESSDAGGRHIERHVQEDIHDFAWTAWDRFETKKEIIEGVEVTVLAPPGYGDHVERELATMRFALPHYGKRYGRYPYPVLTVVHPPASAPEAGGMEYPTLITTGQPSWLPNGVYLVEGVTIHEFGHQYFYGLCASHEDAWPFLDEGVNSYAQSEAMRAWKGPGSGADFLGLRIGDVEAQAERARHYAHDEPVAQSAGSFATGSAYGSLVYGRTAAILETVARAYGKEKMDRALGSYARRFRFRHPSPDDLIGSIDAEVGPAAAAMTRSALFEKGWVDYAITQTGSRRTHPPAGLFDRAGKRETVALDRTSSSRWEGSVLVARRGTLRIPVTVELVAEDGTRTRVSWDGESPSTRIPYAGASRLRAAVVDPDHAVLLDEHPENNWVTAIGAPVSGAPRVFERALYWAATLLGAVGP